MPSKVQQIPVWRACEDCRNRRHKCPHKRAMLLPLKADGSDATFRPVTDLALIALAVSPLKVRKAPTHSRKRRCVGRGKTKTMRRADDEDKEEEKWEGNEEVREEEEIYGTIAVGCFPETLVQYNPSQEEPPPENIRTEQLGPMENEEKLDISLAANQDEDNEGLKAPTTTNDEKSMINNGVLVDEITEGRIINQKPMDQTAEEGRNYAGLVGEKTIQQPVSKATETNDHRYPLKETKEIEEMIDLKQPEEMLEGHQEQSIHQSPIISSDEIGSHQPPINIISLHGNDTKAKIEQETGLELELHSKPKTTNLPESQSPKSSIEPSFLEYPSRSQRLLLPLTPASTNPTPSSPSLAHSTNSLTSVGVNSVTLMPVTGPARWKLPCAKKSRFSGPKIYTPLTLHPPSTGLGIVNYTMPPRRRDEENTDGRKRSNGYRKNFNGANE